MMNPKYLAGLLLVLLLLTGCATSGQASAPADPGEESDDPMAFRVGEQVFTVADFQQRLEQDLSQTIEQLLMQGMTPEDITAEAEQFAVRDSVFDQMVQEHLLLQVARQEGIGIDPQAIDRAIEQQFMFEGAPEVAEQPDLTPQEELEQREQIAEQQLLQNVVARHTTADQVKVRHILLGIEPAVDTSEAEMQAMLDEQRAQAEELVARLEEGASFGRLARQYSDDLATVGQGGSLGWVPRGSMPPEYEEQAFEAELNAPFIVDSPRGVYVVRVEDRQEDRPFDNIEQLNGAQNAAVFYQETFIPWYEAYRDEALNSGLLEVGAGFNPAEVPLPFPDELPDPLPTPELEGVPPGSGEIPVPPPEN